MPALSPDRVALLWTFDADVLTDRQVKILPILQKWMSGRKADPIAHLLTGIGDLPSPVTMKSDMLAATNDLLAKFRSTVIPDVRPIDCAIAAVQLFGKLIDRGNALKLFKICPPPIPYLERRTPSPFEKNRWRSNGVAAELRSLLAVPVTLVETEITPEAERIEFAKIRLGRVLLSSILHGGLINAGSLQSLIERLNGNQPVLDCLGSRVFVELSLGWRGQDDAEFRRWFPDPLTAVLIMQLPLETVALVKKSFREKFDNSAPASEAAEEADEVVVANVGIGGESNPSPGQESAADPVITRNEVWKCIRAYFKIHRQAVGRLPASLGALLDATALDLQTRLPPVLVNYATRTLICHSLKADVWRRLNGYSIRSARMKNSVTEEEPSDGVIFDTAPSSEAEPRWIVPLRAALTGTDRTPILDRLHRLLNTPEPGFSQVETGNVFARFALHIMTSARSGGKILTVTTARSYVLSAARRLGGILGSESIAKLTADEWAAFYTEVLDDAENPGARRKLIRILREFHRFLQDEQQVEGIDAREVFGIGDGLVPVDANILSPREFELIRQELTSSLIRRADPEILQIADLVFTLAYRCGLRRMEVLKLELADLGMDDPAELLVRPTEARRLKTKNSTRKMPLQVLLTADELDRLADWYKKRLNDEKEYPYSLFLFSVPRLGFQFVPQETLFPLLHEVMRGVTRDASLRFHHLRHSFASWTFFRLMSSDAPDVLPAMGKITGIEQVVKDAKGFRDRLYLNHWQTRRHVYACTSLLGHSGPDVSMEHYIHYSDVLLSAHLDRVELAPRLSTVIEASGASTANAYAHGANRSTHQWITHLWRKFCAGEEDVVEDGDGIEKQLMTEPVLIRAWQLIQAHQLDRIDIAELAEKRGFDIQQIENMLQRASAISEYKIGKKPLHRFVERVIQQTPSRKVERTCLPNNLRVQRDRAIAARFMPRAIEVASEQPELSKRVFGYFIANALDNFSGMIFKDADSPDEAADLLAWFRAIGLKVGEIRLTGFDSTQDRQRSKSMGAWRRALNIPGGMRVDKRAPPNSDEKWACPWLGIDAVFPEAVGDEASNARKESSGTGAFRFVWLMSAIVFGYTLPPQRIDYRRKGKG